jgi:hypothetical protein
LLGATERRRHGHRIHLRRDDGDKQGQ